MSDYQPRAGGGWPAQPSSARAQSGQRAYGQPGHGQPPRPAAGRKRRRRRRWLTALVVLLVLILAALGFGDQIARSYAQNKIANQIQTSGLNTKPTVKIEGWPFLTQVLARDLKTIDISATNATADSGKLVFDFTAKATGVHLNSSYTGATVDQINGQALVPFSSVDRLLPTGVSSLSADAADGPNAVTATLAGGVGTVNGTVKLASSNEIVVRLNSASGIAALAGGLFDGTDINIMIPKLPAGLLVRSISVTSQGIVATASASNTTLSE